MNTPTQEQVDFTHDLISDVDCGVPWEKIVASVALRDALRDQEKDRVIAELADKLNDESKDARQKIDTLTAQVERMKGVMEAARAFRPGPHIEHAFYTNDQGLLDAALAALSAQQKP